MSASDRWEKTLFAQIKSSEALADLLAKHIPHDRLPQVVRLLREADQLMVAGVLDRTVTARGGDRGCCRHRKVVNEVAA